MAAFSRRSLFALPAALPAVAMFGAGADAQAAHCQADRLREIVSRQNAEIARLLREIAELAAEFRRVRTLQASITTADARPPLKAGIATGSDPRAGRGIEPLPSGRAANERGRNLNSNRSPVVVGATDAACPAVLVPRPAAGERAFEEPQTAAPVHRRHAAVYSAAGACLSKDAPAVTLSNQAIRYASHGADLGRADTGRQPERAGRFPGTPR